MSSYKEDIARLTKIIENNPGAAIVIDNDAWWLHSAEGTFSGGLNGELAGSRDYLHLDCRYGLGILEVLSNMQGLTIENV